MSVELLNSMNVIARLTRYENALSKASESGTRKVAILIRDDAKRNCPVGTPASTGIRGYIGGSLKKSIRLQVYAKTAGVVHNIGVSAGGYITNPNTGLKVGYAWFVEKGTSKMSAQPFLGPAKEKYKRKLPSQVLEDLKLLVR